MATANTQVIELDPKRVMIGENIRHSLLAFRVKGLADAILAHGSVHTPVEVEELTPKVNGFTHKLTVGHMRHAAVALLNESGAGLKLPAIVRPAGTPAERLKRQISENQDRANLSPIDQAVAVKALMDAGVSRPEILQAFSRPGGRKGLAMQPASNAWFNMVLSFLDLPKGIQAKIHDGTVGVAAAYQLTKLPADKREAVLAKAEADRQKAIDLEEKDDKAASSAAEKEETATKKVTDAKTAAETTGAALTEAETKLAGLQEKLRLAKLPKSAGGELPDDFMSLTDDAKKKISESHNAIKTDIRGAEKLVTSASKDADKAAKALEALTAPAAPKAAKAEAPAKAAKKAAPVGPKDVQKAAKATGVTKAAPLTIREAADAAAELAKSKNKKIASIGGIFSQILSGKLAVKEAAEALALVK